jgi:hypothetical protein
LGVILALFFMLIFSIAKILGGHAGFQSGKGWMQCDALERGDLGEP